MVSSVSYRTVMRDHTCAWKTFEALVKASLDTWRRPVRSQLANVQKSLTKMAYTAVDQPLFVGHDGAE